MELLGIGPLEIVFILLLLLPAVLIFVVIRALWHKMTRIETKIDELQTGSNSPDGNKPD
jgi:preprotein translocase subunit YajC